MKYLNIFNVFLKKVKFTKFYFLNINFAQIVIELAGSGKLNIIRYLLII